MHVAAVALRRSRALLDAHRLAAALPARGADLAASTLLAAHDTERLFEFAKHAYIAVHHSR